MSRLLKLLAVSVLIASTSSLAFAQKIRPIKVQGIDTSLNGATLIALGTDGAAASATISNRSASVTPTTSTARLYVRDAGQIVALIGSPLCGKRCKRSTVVLNAKAGKKIRVGKNNNGILLAKGKKGKLKKSFKSNVKESRTTLETSISSKGLASVDISSLSIREVKGLAVDDLDEDNDGLVDSIDSDDDGDGVLDNYDPDTQAPQQEEGEEQTAFSVFSNFKLGIENTINLHATGIDTDTLDSLLASTQTLAIGVAGADEETTELDCGELSYCSSGGTGEKQTDNSAFPGEAGGGNDTDGDGLGEISAGNTGDFQLRTGASSEDISGGDTFIQQITGTDSSSREASGMLNFVFSSTPALKTLSVNEGEAQTIDYDAESIIGSTNNCFVAPSTGDVSLTIVGWRPQRPGQTDAGEAEYVDLGLSNIVIDIPNAPCTISGMGGCSGMGPGACSVSAYSTSDENLSVGANSLEDSRGDVDADSTNTFSFTINLSDCLANATNGPITWNNEETLFVDLQFASSYGDNSAQKFCVKRSTT